MILATPAQFFQIKTSDTQVNYNDVPIATAQFQAFWQP
jgi:hypothetical protein